MEKFEVADRAVIDVLKHAFEYLERRSVGGFHHELIKHTHHQAIVLAEYIIENYDNDPLLPPANY